MSDSERGGDEFAPEKLKETVSQQEAEIRRLRGRLEDEQFAGKLKEALSLASTAGTIASPVSHSRLLEMIVETASHVISARAASLFLIDEEAQELTFEVALGPRAQEVKKFRVPLGHGIAGLVAVSGQPIAVSDASNDPRQASDIAEAVGYKPESILCVPLFYNDRITGVLQLLDKEGGTSFSAGDMEVLGLFANQAAVAIEQSRTHRNLAALIGEVLGSLGGADGGGGASLARGATAFAASIEQDPAYKQALTLAALVQEIAWQGEEEARACRTVLEAFAGYLRSRGAQDSLYGGTG